MTTHYMCTECYKSISESELAAADPKVPLIICCKCLSNTCCVTGCTNKYISKYDCIKHKRVFEPCCALHIGITQQCRHSIDCHNKVKNGVFCNTHRCTGILQDKSRCQSECIQGKMLCPVHASQCVPVVERNNKNSWHALKKIQKDLIQKDLDVLKRIGIKKPVIGKTIQSTDEYKYIAPQS